MRERVTRQPGRRWERTIVFAMLLLAGGAIVNVVVAWGCAGRVQLTEADMMHGLSTPRFNNAGLGWELPVKSPFPNELASRTYAVRPACRTATVTVFHWRHRRGVGPVRATFHMEAGWPLKTFAGTTNFRSHRNFTVTGAIHFDRPGSDQPSNSQQIVFLPATPIWPGLIINTLFYAAVLWPICLTPYAARRMIRRRRGRCMNCAYPIGTSPVCTECGAVITRTAARMTEA